MPYREFHYRWEFDLKSARKNSGRLSPTRIASIATPVCRRSSRPRPRASDCGMRGAGCGFRCMGCRSSGKSSRSNGCGRSASASARTYSKGPIAELRALAELTPRADGGTHLVTTFGSSRRSLLGAVAIPLQIEIFSSRDVSPRPFENMTSSLRVAERCSCSSQSEVELDAATRDRLRSHQARSCIAMAQRRGGCRSAGEFIERADDFAVARIRPYELADEWKLPRRACWKLPARDASRSARFAVGTAVSAVSRRAGETGNRSATSVRKSTAKPAALISPSTSIASSN